jgi:predicted DNA binding CopG/RHH family protein
MKQKRRKPSDDMRAEYRFDYSKAVRGKYHQLLMEGSNVVFQQNPTSGKIKYTDEPLGDLRVIPDFLPRPEELVFRDEGVKVTIALSKRSVEYFKGEARKHHTQYQRMIRRLLDAYAEHHSRPSSAQSTRTRAKLARTG